jgi:chromosome segregation ATPase
MNNERRKEIAALRTRLEAVQSEFESIRDELESVKDSEREAFDNMPESLQQGDRGQAAEAAADNLESAHGELESFDFDSVFSYLDSAAE